MKYTAFARKEEGRKSKPLQALLLFYQKVEDKLVEYGKTEKEAWRKERAYKVEEDKKERIKMDWYKWKEME